MCEDNYNSGLSQKIEKKKKKSENTFFQFVYLVHLGSYIYTYNISYIFLNFIYFYLLLSSNVFIISH